MYALKQVPEDFVVDEVCRLPDDSGGRYSYFVLEKAGMDTREVMRRLAASLGVRISDLGYSGMKDRHAVTSQLISVRDVGRDEVLSAASGFSLRFAGCGSIPVSLGCLDGNRFRIVVRNLAPGRLPVLERRLRSFRSSPVFPNYFGEQRFSAANHIVGGLLVKGKFKEASGLAAGISRSIAARLSRGIDAVSCFRSADRRSVLIYIHAYQALIFNRSVSAYFEGLGACRRWRIGPLDISLPEFIPECLNFPIVGFGTDLSGFSKGISATVGRVLESESVSPGDFVIRQLPLLSCEGGVRGIMCTANGFEYGFGDDELNAGRIKCSASFFLPKGSYATVLAACLFSGD